MVFKDYENFFEKRKTDNAAKMIFRKTTSLPENILVCLGYKQFNDFATDMYVSITNSRVDMQ